MATRPFSVVYDYVLPYVPGVEPRLVDSHIRMATREFLRRTLLWRKSIQIQTVPGEREYVLQPFSASNPPPTPGVDWVPLSAATGVSVSVLLGAGVTQTPAGFLAVGGGADGFFFQLENGGADSVQFRLRTTGYGDFTPDPPLGYPAYKIVEGEGGVVALVELDLGGALQQDEFNETLIVEPPQYAESFPSINATFEVLVLAETATPVEPEICEPYVLFSATLDGRVLTPLKESDRRPAGVQAARDPAEPRGWWMKNARTVELDEAPLAAQTLEVDLACVLTMERVVDVMPEFVAVDYRDAIAAGTIASLMALPRKPWTDLQTAVIYANRFAAACTNARNKLRGEHFTTASRARPPRFGK